MAWFGVAIVSMAILLVVLLLSQSLTSNASGAGSATPQLNQSVLQAHLNKLEQLNVSGVCTDYVYYAVVTWYGPSPGQTGVYDSPTAIHNLVASIAQSTRNLSVAIESFTVNPSPRPGIESVDATLSVSNTTAQGKVTGTVAAQYQFVYADGVWKISQETWIYKTNIAVPAG